MLRLTGGRQRQRLKGPTRRSRALTYISLPVRHNNIIPEVGDSLPDLWFAHGIRVYNTATILPIIHIHTHTHTPNDLRIEQFHTAKTDGVIILSFRYSCSRLSMMVFYIFYIHNNIQVHCRRFIYPYDTIVLHTQASCIIIYLLQGSWTRFSLLFSCPVFSPSLLSLYYYILCRIPYRGTYTNMYTDRSCLPLGLFPITA